MNLSGKTAIVTGGSRGFGRAIVEALAKKDMHVIAIARDKHHLETLKQDVSGNIETIAADVTDPVVAARVIQQENPQVLVLNAGAIPLYKPTSQHSWDTFSLHWDTDVKGVFLWAKEALLKPLEQGSHIIVMSSGAAMAGSAGSGGYAPAKAALWQLSKNLAFDAQALNIKVQCLFPNLTDATDLGKSAVRYYTNKQGIDESEFISRIGSHGFNASTVAENVMQLLMAEAHPDLGYRIAVEGLESISNVIRG